MTGQTFDIAIVGGGLAGGLIALAVTQARPDLALRLIEAGAQPGGNHRWSWFASDLPAGGEALLAPFKKTVWNDGYDVRFPDHRRHLASRYCSLASEDFAATLARELPAGAILAGAEAAALDAGGVTLEDGQRIDARAVIDCRGFAPTANLSGGWQVFMGRHLRVSRPHGLTAPVIMDATVAQLGGYRFVYVLPLGERELFIEDTYYEDEPTLDHAALSSRLDDYERMQGWEGEILGSETGVLPVITGGDFSAFQAEQRIAGVSMAGARGGFVHPLTSYTLPFAVGTALAVAAEADLPGEQLAARIEERAREHWQAMGFYRLLGRMLFGAAHPQERYRVFERFYRLSEGLIERFYAGRSTIADRARVLAGKPPVPISRAVAALTRPAPPLAAPQHEDYS
ncbi:lycopene beta-cyclase CrtY [Aurantiacibacter suaedae]|uniref:lycopene beta-cyclase CrtY n=1 Tax=Aurantiacibacter suaedae TaxID=2545755 RepID=UPI0010F90F55|nr:lycopene beta-cyclase CrtY [Aurantiacibacter suaedae]